MIKKALLGILVSTTMLGGSMSVFADSVEERERVVTAAEVKVQDVMNDLTEKKSKHFDLLNKIDNLTTEIKTLNVKIDKEKENKAKVEKDLASTKKSIENNTKSLEDMARSAQEHSDELSPLNAVVNSESVSEIVSKTMAISKFAELRDEKVEHGEKLQKEQEELIAELDSTTKALKNDASVLKEKKTALEKEKDVYEKDIKENNKALVESQDNLKDAKSELENAHKEILKQKEAIEKEAAKAAEESKTNKDETEKVESAKTVVAQVEEVEQTIVQAKKEVEQKIENHKEIEKEYVKPQEQSDIRQRIVDEAMKHLGKGYTQGPGRSGPNMFDCSGLAHYCYQLVAGIEIGGWTVPQETSGTQISVSEAQPGDLLFWGARGGTYHVAISTGGGNYVHAANPNDGVTTGSVQWFTPDFAVRVI